MSWSIQLIGKVDNVKAALEAYDAMNTKSQEEFEEAKPHLLALVAMNTSENAAISLWASGSNYISPPTEAGGVGKKIGSCTVKIEGISGLV